MSTEKDKKPNLFNRARQKFRLVIINNETFEERWSFRLSALNIFSSLGFLILLLIIGTYALVSYTSLKETIPGYPNVDDVEKRKLQEIDNLKTIELLQEENRKYRLYTNTLQLILSGENPSDSVLTDTTSMANNTSYDSISFPSSPEDSLLREEVLAEDQYNIAPDNIGTSTISMPGKLFFTPLKGEISKSFNRDTDHLGVDIIGPENELIKATLDGTIIFASWTSDGGHVIMVQHSHNLISVYKHNSALLKNMGDKIKAGDPIAIIGNTGGLTDGPHLHFELWHNSRPIDPQHYLVF